MNTPSPVSISKPRVGDREPVIARGKRRDWAELRSAVLADPAVLEKALRVCQAHVADPSAQRYHFWKQYAERHLA